VGSGTFGGRGAGQSVSLSGHRNRPPAAEDVRKRRRMVAAVLAVAASPPRTTAPAANGPVRP
jgi:hypothetical protein